VDYEYDYINKHNLACLISVLDDMSEHITRLDELHKMGRAFIDKLINGDMENPYQVCVASTEWKIMCSYHDKARRMLDAIDSRLKDAQAR